MGKKISKKITEEEAQEEEGEAEKEDKKTKFGNKEIYVVLGMLAFLVAVFFASYYVFQSLNKFEYEGLTFTKTRFGDIPVFHHYYYFNLGDELFKYNLYLRNDPRKNVVSITGRAVDEGVEFPLGNEVYVSVDPAGLVGCEYGSVGISQLSSFLADNQLKVIGASPNETIAEEVNVEYATCESKPADVVIIVRGGDKTEIEYKRDNCAVINIANCEVLEAIEKFQVKSILDARERVKEREAKLN